MNTLEQSLESLKILTTRDYFLEALNPEAARMMRFALDTLLTKNKDFIPPPLKFPPDWEVLFRPSATKGIHFWVKKNEIEVSVFLDLFGMTSSWDPPHWEIYGFDTIQKGPFLFPVKEVDKMMKYVDDMLNGIRLEEEDEDD
jgi:hypothetical protein